MLDKLAQSSIPYFEKVRLEQRREYSRFLGVPPRTAVSNENLEPPPLSIPIVINQLSDEIEACGKDVTVPGRAELNKRDEYKYPVVHQLVPGLQEKGIVCHMFFDSKKALLCPTCKSKKLKPASEKAPNLLHCTNPACAERNQAYKCGCHCECRCECSCKCSCICICSLKELGCMCPCRCCQCGKGCRSSSSKGHKPGECPKRYCHRRKQQGKSQRCPEAECNPGNLQISKFQAL